LSLSLIPSLLLSLSLCSQHEGDVIAIKQPPSLRATGVNGRRRVSIVPR
jgi:hypothetical protein